MPLKVKILMEKPLGNDNWFNTENDSENFWKNALFCVYFLRKMFTLCSNIRRTTGRAKAVGNTAKRNRRHLWSFSFSVVWSVGRSRVRCVFHSKILLSNFIFLSSGMKKMTLIEVYLLYILWQVIADRGFTCKMSRENVVIFGWNFKMVAHEASLDLFISVLFSCLTNE